MKEKDVKVGKLRIKQVLWQLWLKLVKFCCNFSTVILLSAQFWFWLNWLCCISRMRINFRTLICMLYDLTLHFKIVKYVLYMVSEFNRGLYVVLNNTLFIVKRFDTPGFKWLFRYWINTVNRYWIIDR